MAIDEKLHLGRNKIDGDIYLSKHSWDCDWYYGFGYLGNKNTHFHMEQFLRNGPDLYSPIEKFLTETKITQPEWWVILDMFKQAYALKHCAEVYQHGGHLSSNAGVTDILRSGEKAKALNEDLGKLLDRTWDYVRKVVEK
jgi:hypothetical protein